MSKKIGILTYIYVNNYGANLQAFALKKMLENLGAKVEVVNYQSGYVSNRMRKRLILKLKELDNVLIKFKSFLNSIKFHKKICTFVKLFIAPVRKPNINKIIVGSDQVWNENINGGDLEYLLIKYNIKKYSYAASFGVNNLTDKYKEQICVHLNKFSMLSVREKTGKNILNELGYATYVVLDPTLLFNQSDWMKMLNINNINSNNAVFVYFIGNTTNDVINYCISNYNEDLIINYNNTPYLSKKIYNMSCGFPQDWIKNIARSKIVVTNSYHGIIFSIIFSKNFVFCYKRSLNFLSRIFDLFNLLEITGTDVVCGETIFFMPILNYNIINSKIKEMKDKSISFLRKIIGD